MPKGACPQLYWTTICACLISVRYRRIQINAGNTIQLCRRNGEQGKWEPSATCRNVHEAKHVRLHGLDPNTEERVVCSPKAKTPLENVGLDGKLILKCIAQEVGVTAWSAFMALTTGFTWTSVVPVMISSGVNEHSLCLALRLHLSSFSNKHQP
jgi:hypothetical protein